MANLSKLAGLCAVLAVGCSGKKASTAPKNDNNVETSIPKVDPTLCDTNGKNVVTYDLNKDNRPDVWRLYKTEDEGGTKIEFLTCKQVDANRDGTKDWVVAYNRKGNPLFERRDLDFDGKWDVNLSYDTKSTSLAESERDTDFDGRYDVKEYYDTRGEISNIRSDRNGDGQPDRWEQYKDDILLAILYDDDFDGKVDRREEIPGARPKVVMPTAEESTATGSLDDNKAKRPTPAPKKK
ncbi:MAG TPA: hypothetical protein VK427_22065 [Kofleriaceae bacterium]|nr:hypothetical protein [Kofleriaceae bacterium]